MLKLKEIIDTVSVMVANFLSFKLTSWEDSKEQAAQMREQVKTGQLPAGLEIVDGEGQTVEPVQLRTPLRYLANELLNWAAVAAIVYAGSKVLSAVASIAFTVLVIAAICWAANKLFDLAFGEVKTVYPSAKPEAAPAA